MLPTHAFFDEFDKIAASKWREMLRAGGISSGGAGKLRGALRPGIGPVRSGEVLHGGPLLDYGREAAGIESGTQNILQRLKAKMHTFSPREAVSQVPGAILNKPGAREALKNQAMAVGIGSMGGGYAAVPALNEAFTSPATSILTRGTKGDVRKGVDVLARRHEADELRAVAHGIAQKDVHPFRVARSSQGTLKDRIMTTQSDAARGLLEKAQEWGKKLRGSNISSPSWAPGLGKKVQDVGKGLEGGAATGKTALPPKGKILSGQHMSPFPVLQEGMHSPMLDPGVARKMRPFRQGEIETLGPMGYQHGVATPPSVARGIQKANLQGKFDFGG